MLHTKTRGAGERPRQENFFFSFLARRVSSGETTEGIHSLWPEGVLGERPPGGMDLEGMKGPRPKGALDHP